MTTNLTRHDFGQRVEYAANKGYTTMRGSVLRMTVLCKVEHLCFVLKFGGKSPALRVAPTVGGNAKNAVLH
jgi:hypothetical protein